MLWGSFYHIMRYKDGEKSIHGILFSSAELAARFGYSVHLKLLGKVKYVVVTNPKRDVSTAKLSIPTRVQRQIMDVLGIKYIKSET